MPLAIGRRVEIDEERGIAESRTEQLAKRRPGQAPEAGVLAMHESDVLDLEVAGCKMVVPHQGQPLAERVGREEHPVEPPGLEPPRLAGRDRRLDQQRRRSLEILRRRGTERSELPFEQPLDALLGPFGKVALDLAPASSESRAAVQMHNPA